MRSKVIRLEPVMLPLRIRSPLNSAQGTTRKAMFAKAAERKRYRWLANIASLAAIRTYRVLHPRFLSLDVAAAKDFLVSIVRLAPRGLDMDNCVAGCKSIRDGVADALGVDDRDLRITWCYSQEKSKEYGVRIEIELRM